MSSTERSTAKPATEVVTEVVTEGILVLFQRCTRETAGVLTEAAFVPDGEATPEFLRACELLDGKMLSELDEHLDEAEELVVRFCERHMLPDEKTRVTLPDRTRVTRAVLLRDRL